MDTRPRLLVGTVMHCRTRPAHHFFRYPVFTVEWPLRSAMRKHGRLFGVDRAALVSVHARDHGARDGSSLLAWAEAQLQQHGLRCEGEIVLHTFPRVFGFVFNPVSFYYCHDRHGTLTAVLAEVNNTFGESHTYVLHQQGQAITPQTTLRTGKTLHVSPFNKIEGHYEFHFERSPRGHRARIDYWDAQGLVLATSITGTPQPWNSRSLWRTLLRMPLLTLGVVARIHWQAFRLWRKGVPFFGTRPPAAMPDLQETR